MKYEPEGRGQYSSERDNVLRIKLSADIKKFEEQLAQLKANGNHSSFADVYTLKELIRTRQDMLKRLQ